MLTVLLDCKTIQQWNKKYLFCICEPGMGPFNHSYIVTYGERMTCADPDGMGGAGDPDHTPPPLENHKSAYRFPRNTGTDPTLEAIGPLGSNCF